MPRYDLGNLQEVIETSFKWAKILEIKKDKAKIEIVDKDLCPTGEVYDNVPFYYHCEPEKLLKYPSPTFKVDDFVRVKFDKIVKENDIEYLNPLIIGFLEKPKICSQPVIILHGGETNWISNNSQLIYYLSYGAWKEKSQDKFHAKPITDFSGHVVNYRYKMELKSELPLGFYIYGGEFRISGRVKYRFLSYYSFEANDVCFIDLGDLITSQLGVGKLKPLPFKILPIQNCVPMIWFDNNPYDYWNQMDAIYFDANEVFKKCYGIEPNIAPLGGQMWLAGPLQTYAFHCTPETPCCFPEHLSIYNTNTWKTDCNGPITTWSFCEKKFRPYICQIYYRSPSALVQDENGSLYALGGAITERIFVGGEPHWYESVRCHKYKINRVRKQIIAYGDGERRTFNPGGVFIDLGHKCINPHSVTLYWTSGGKCYSARDNGGQEFNHPLIVPNTKEMKRRSYWYNCIHYQTGKIFINFKSAPDKGTPILLDYEWFSVHRIADLDQELTEHADLIQYIFSSRIAGYWNGRIYFYTDIVRRYNIASNTWTKLGHTIHHPYGNCDGAGIQDGKYLYIYGGWGFTKENGGYLLHTYNTLIRFNMETGSTEYIATGPKNLVGASMALYIDPITNEKKLYIAGGCTMVVSGGKWSNFIPNYNMYCYNLTKNCWEDPIPMPKGAWGCTCVFGFSNELFSE